MAEAPAEPLPPRLRAWCMAAAMACLLPLLLQVPLPLAIGLAVVASDLPANRQWLGDEPARLVPLDDAAALASALRRLRDDDAWARRFRARRSASPACETTRSGAQPRCRT